MGPAHERHRARQDATRLRRGHVIPAHAGTARAQRTDGRVLVYPGTHLRRGAGHPPPAHRVLCRRGHRARRGAITGGGTFFGGIFHTLPFLIPGYAAALAAAIAVVAAELLILAWLRHKFFQTSFPRSFLAVTVGGAIIAALSAALGLAAGG